MTPAQALVWEIYITRLEEILADQRLAFEGGVPAKQMVMAVPSAEQIKLAEAALALAAKRGREELWHTAIGPIVKACDAIDNSHTKSETVKKIRADIEEVYQQLLQMKDAPRVAQDGVTG